MEFSSLQISSTCSLTVWSLYSVMCFLFWVFHKNCVSHKGWWLPSDSLATIWFLELFVWKCSQSYRAYQNNMHPTWWMPLFSHISQTPRSSNGDILLSWLHHYIIHPPIHPSFHPSTIHPSFHQSVCLWNCLSVYFSEHMRAGCTPNPWAWYFPVLLLQTRIFPCVINLSAVIKFTLTICLEFFNVTVISCSIMSWIYYHLFAFPFNPGNIYTT